MGRIGDDRMIMPENRRNQRQRAYDKRPEQEGYEADEEES